PAISGGERGVSILARPRAVSAYDRRLHLADDLADRLAILHLHVAANNSVDRNALDLPAAPRRGLVLAVKLVGIDRHLFVHIDDRNVSIRAEPDGALLRIHLPDLRRILAGDPGVMVQAEPSFVHLREQERNGGLDAAES